MTSTKEEEAKNSGQFLWMLKIVLEEIGKVSGVLNHFRYLHVQCQTQIIFGDTIYSCYCKFKLVTPPPFPPPHGGGWGVEKFLILITLDCWKRHFQEQNYIENYFYLLKSTKSTKTTSQKCWRNIIWADFFGCPYWSNDIKTHLGSPVMYNK